MKQSPLSDDDCVIFDVGSVQHCYIPITKVSSTFLRRAIPGQRFNIHTWQWYDPSSDPVPDVDQLRYLVMLRDPVERWISGIVEFWCRAYPDRAWNPRECQDWLFDTVEFDVHTRPQVEFLHAVDQQRCTWLWMDNAVEYNAWFRDHNIGLKSVDKKLRNQVNDHHLIYFGPNGERSRKPVAGWPTSVPDHQIKSAVEYTLAHHPNAVNKLKDYYRQDYDLIQSVSFY